MDESAFQPPPKAHEAIIADTRKIGFQLWCWPPVGALLRVMAATKPGGRMLEIGTGTGVGTCWLLDGMDTEARLTTVDIDPKVQAIAQAHLGMDPRVTILSEDGAATIGRQPPNPLDLIFADGGAGKHTLLDEALALLRPGGIYICDDTKPIRCGLPSTPRKFRRSWKSWPRDTTFVASTSIGRAAPWSW